MLFVTKQISPRFYICELQSFLMTHTFRFLGWQQITQWEKMYLYCKNRLTAANSKFAF
jgi:hypothetical protein